MAGSSFLIAFIILFAVYLLASTAGLISEKSGVTNIAINGTMIMGALAYVSLASWATYWEAFGVFAPFVTLLFAVLIGMIYAQVLSFATVNLMTDQIITGTALNLFAPILSSSILFLDYFKVDQVPFPTTELSWYVVPLAFLIIASIIILFVILLLNKTAFGLRLISAGENPLALEGVGYSARKMRWQALIISGALAGLAGGMFMFYNASLFTGAVNGSGYIALAIVVIGKWKLKGIILWSFVFALIFACTIPLMYWIPNIPYELMNIIPFLIPLVVLCIFKSKNNSKSCGVPFKKNIQE